MILNDNEIFWGDSILEKIEITFDEMKMKVYHDVFPKYIIIKCSQCIGMTSIMTWDEDIIENIFIQKAPIKNSMLTLTQQMYGPNSYDSEKSLDGDFYELKVLLINTWSFSIICKKIELYDECTC